MTTKNEKGESTALPLSNQSLARQKKRSFKPLESKKKKNTMEYDQWKTRKGASLEAVTVHRAAAFFFQVRIRYHFSTTLCV